MLNPIRKYVLPVAFLVAIGCGDEHVDTPGGGNMPDAGGSGTPASTSTISLDATGGKRTFLSARMAKIIDVATPAGSSDWDTSLTAYLLQTNSGPSGPGKATAYGPVTDKSFDEILSASIVPHSSAWRSDRLASPFDGWYLYDKCPEGMHTLASRFRMYGIETAGKRYKMQILSYYGVVMGAPQSGRYTIRYAEVSSAGAGPLQRIADVDASKSPAYIDLAAGAVVAVADAKTSSAWDVGLSKSDLFVNGGVAGPKGVRGVDLDATRMEADADVCKMTEASEQARFDAIAWAQLDAATLRWKTSDIEDAFQKKWFVYDATTHTIGPAKGTWILRSADGASFFKLEVTAIDGASMTEAGRVTLRFAAIAGM